MPDPRNFVRSCQIERGEPDLHDIPTRMSHGELVRYVLGRKGRRSSSAVRAEMRRAYAGHPTHYDTYLRHREGARIINVASVLSTIATRKDLTT